MFEQKNDVGKVIHNNQSKNKQTSLSLFLFFFLSVFLSFCLSFFLCLSVFPSLSLSVCVRQRIVFCWHALNNVTTVKTAYCDHLQSYHLTIRLDYHFYHSLIVIRLHLQYKNIMVNFIMFMLL